MTVDAISFPTCQRQLTGCRYAALAWLIHPGRRPLPVEHLSARVFRIDSGGRNLSFYDPATGKFTLIRTCFPTHHLNFARCERYVVDERRRRRARRARLAKSKNV
jgi:hypothetical protein